MSQSDAYTDVVELCALLQCLGFSVKSLESSDGNVSQDGGSRTVIINCQSSGLHVVLENAALSSSCSCPATRQQQTSGVWQVSGITGGKQLDKEFGCSLLGALPKSHRERLTRDLNNMIRCIKQNNETDLDRLKDKEFINKSVSMVELKTPEKVEDRHYQIKAETPTRYRSLDTLTGTKPTEQPLPAPGILQKPDDTDTSVEKIENKLVSVHQAMCGRQSTYTLSSTPGSSRRRNKTSSPIQTPQTSVLDTLITAERAAEDLRNKLATVIRDLAEDGKNDSSMSSLTLDVSKISVLKGAESSKAQFASSPNLSGAGMLHEDLFKSRLKRYESASTSNLAATKPSTAKDGKMSRLRRLSPNIFKLKKDSPKVDAVKVQDNKSKLTSLLRPRIVTPVRTARTHTEPSPNLSSSRKKFTHIKSTIPRLTKKE